MRIAVLLRCAPTMRKKATYVLDTVLHTIGVGYRLVETASHIEADELLICYGRGEDVAHVPYKLVIHDSPQAALYFSACTPYEASAVRLIPWEQREIPVLFADAGVSPFLEWADPHTVTIPYDLIASAFFFLSCWQELTGAPRDQHGRFPYAASLQSQLHYGQRPIVAEYLQIIEAALQRLHESRQERFAPEPRWQEGRDWAICLTHDVHQLKKWTAPRAWIELRRTAALVLKHRRPRQGLAHGWQSLQSIVRRENPVSPRLILEQEHRYGVHSSFFMMTGGPAAIQGQRYWQDHKTFQALVQAIERAGSEVGLHQSYASYNNLVLMTQEKAHMDRHVQQSLYGGRQHFLRFEIPTTWQLHQQAGLWYDSTLGFAEQPGFRSGFCFPCHPYDTARDQPLDIWELPLTVMDSTLEAYQHLSPEAGLRCIEELMAVVKRYRGLFVVLWHTDFAGERPAWAPVYQRVLELASDGGVYAGSGAEILTWWEQRTKRLTGSLVHA